MDRELVESILGVIKTSTDKTVIVKALIKLRTDLIKDKYGIGLFREVGGLAPMVRLLSKPHEKILEVVLSILANCCTDEESCKEAFEYKCVSPLAIILKSIPNPVIQCRACRLLGNLSKCDSVQLLATHGLTIAKSVCQIIAETSDVQTRMMAYRACRFLLSDPHFLKQFLHYNGFVTLLHLLAAVMKNDMPPQEEQLLKDVQPETKVMGLKQTQHREKYFEEVARHLEGVRSDIFDHEVLKHSSRPTSSVYAMPKEKAALELACEILKCLLVMSELQISYAVWESLKCVGCSLAPIVFFISGDRNAHREVALKILANFGKNRGAFEILSSSDAIVGTCELLVSANLESPLSEREKRHCITIICALSPDACNRSKIRRSGALRKLIAIVRNSQSQTEISSILHLLNFFEYDNMSMELMLREGLISVLIKELHAFLINDDEYHKKRREERQQNSKKRKFPEILSETNMCKFAKVREDSLIDCDSPSSSPRSNVSPSSPCSSRSMSPIGSNLFKFDAAASDDETYSPVCSDDDEETVSTEQRAEPSNALSPPTDNFDIMKLLDTAGRSEVIEDNMSDKVDDDETSQDTPAAKIIQQNFNLPPGTIDIIETLLFRSTLLVDKRVELGKPETMKTLIKAINLFGANNNFAGSLTNILLESQFFAQVVNQGIPHLLFQLTKSQEMHKDGFAFLETLTCVGESNYGKAELARLLRSDNEISQKRAAIAVAYIIKNRRLLHQFLNDGNGLALLLNAILCNKRDEFTTEAVEALTIMSRNTLGICLPQNNSTKLTSEEGEYMVYNETECDGDKALNCDMRFVVHDLDDDSKPPQVVPFSKQLLCDTSEVFNTMLTSDFREGKDGEIHLHSCTVSGLKYFLDLVVRQDSKLKPRVPLVGQYHVVLEAFEMTRVYIIPAMEEFLLEVLTCLMDASNCLSVLEWSIKNYHAELMEMAINYCLCSELCVDEKVTLFHNAEYSTYSSEWFQMIFDAILLRCRTTDNGTPVF